MTWFKVDDGFHCHPKVLNAGNEAVGLYVRCGSYCAQHLTDGFVPSGVALLYGNRKLFRSLEANGLWIAVDGGWQMHDYLEYNRSRKEVETDRQAAADRQRKARSKREAVKNHGVSHAGSHAVTHDEVTEHQDAVTHDEVTPQSHSESRRDSHRESHDPDPTRSSYGTTKKMPAASRGDRIKLAQEITTAYTDLVPLSRFPAILGIVDKALRAEIYEPEMIKAALLRLAAEGRSVTLETLRIEVEGRPPTPLRRAGPGRDADGVMRDPKTKVAIER